MLRRVARSKSKSHPPIGGWTDKALKRQALAIRDQDFRELCAERGELYEDCTLENYEIQNPSQREIIAALEAFEYDRNLIFGGHCGTGKDHLLMAMAKRAIYRFRQVKWINGQDFLGSARERMFRDFEDLQQRMVAPEILAISDPLPADGKALTRDEANALYRIVDDRYNRKRPIWMTINAKSSQEMAERMSLPVTDRLLAPALVLLCDWDSYRKQLSTLVPRKKP